MCKFTNRLFVFAVLSLFYAELFIEAAPCSKKKKKCDVNKEITDYDQDIYIDQRQKGGENFRIKMDGFFIGARQPNPSDLINIGDTLLGNLGEELLLGLNKNNSKFPEPLGLLNFKGLSSRANKQQADPQKIETIFIEKEADAPQNLVDESLNGAQTKIRIYRLLNLLRDSHEE